MVFYLGRPAFAIEGEKVKIREKNKMKDDGEKIKKKTVESDGGLEQQQFSAFHRTKASFVIYLEISPFHAL